MCQRGLRHLWSGVAVLLTLAGAGEVARAQESDSGRITLNQVEASHRAVELEETERLAVRALRQGSRDLDETTRLYELIGYARALLGRPAEAEQAYLRLLAIEPDRPVDPSLSPRLRPPFFEARGFWAATTNRLGARVTLVDRSNPHFNLHLSDPLSMAGSIAFHYRPAGASEYTTVERPVSGVVRIPAEGIGEVPTVEYYLEVLDPHRNTIVSEGRAVAPSELPNPRRPVEDPGDGTGEDGGSVFESPWFWGVVGVLAAGALVAGGILLFYEPPTNGRVVAQFER